MKNIVLDSNDIINKIRRISFEIIEKNIDEKEIYLIGILPNGKYLSQKINSFIIENSSINVNLHFIDIDKKNFSIKEISFESDADEIKNKVIVLVNLCILNGTTTGSTSAIQRTTSGSSTFIGIPQSGYGNRQNGGSAELYEERTDSSRSVSYTAEDTPGAGTHTYTVMVDPNGYSLYVNRSESDGDASDYTRGTSSLIVMEVAAWVQ